MEKRLYNWLQKNIINQETYELLLKEVKEEAEKRRKTGLTITMYIIGIILLGLGIISFIAANNWLLAFLMKNDFIKIFLLSLITFLSFYFGYVFAYKKRNLVGLGKALICLSSILIGTDYMLIAQIYNLNAHNSFLYFLWSISIFPLAYVFKEKFINCLASSLFIISFILYYFELALDTKLLWTIFMPIILGSIFYLAGSLRAVTEKFNDFAVFYKIIGLKAVFITLLILTCSSESSYNISSWQYYIPVSAVMICFIINGIINKSKDDLYIIEAVYFFLLLSGLLTVMLLNSLNPTFIMIFAHIFIIIMIYYALKYGHKLENNNLISMTHLFLEIYLFVMFCRWGWSFFDKTLFFLLSGIIIITMGILFEKKRKELTNGK